MFNNYVLSNSLTLLNYYKMVYVKLIEKTIVYC